MTEEKIQLQQRLREILNQEKEELAAKNLAFAEGYKDVKYALETVHNDTYICYTLLCVDSVESQLDNPTYAVYIKGAAVVLTLDSRPNYAHKSLCQSNDLLSIGEHNKEDFIILTKEQYDMLLESYKNIAASYEKQFKSFLNCLQKNDQL